MAVTTEREQEEAARSQVVQELEVIVAENSLWKGSISLPVPAFIPGGLILQKLLWEWLERCGKKRALQRFWQLPVHGEKVMTVGFLPALIQHGELGVFKNYLDTTLCPVL